MIGRLRQRLEVRIAGLVPDLLAARIDQIDGAGEFVAVEVAPHPRRPASGPVAGADQHCVARRRQCFDLLLGRLKIHQLNSSFLIRYQLSRLRVTVSGESTLALKPPPSGFTLGVMAGTAGIAGMYSTAASVCCPSCEVRKSMNNLPAFGCGAFLVRPTECMGAEMGSTFSHSTGAPFCALSTA